MLQHKLEVLSRSPLFEMLSEPELSLLAELSRPIKLAAGDAVFHEGDLGDAVYVIASGEVEVFRSVEGRDVKIATLVAPLFFGEMSLIDKEYRSATVRARTDAELLHLTAENLNTFRKNFREGFLFLVINIARVLSARLRDTNARLATLQKTA